MCEKMLVFMVAEKPALAETIAKVLSEKRCSSRRGFNGACHVHEWNGHFENRQCLFRMTSVCGHVMSVDFTGHYNKWDAVEPIELFHAPIKKKETNPNLKMPAFLSKEASGASYVVLWLDCDLEGENICFEVLFSIKNSWNYIDSKVFRAKFSSITETDLKAAFRNLQHPNANEAMSVDARQELDLRIGCAFTRFQTMFFKNKYDGLDSNCVSYGPCQTPSLAFCVDRYDVIQSFRSEDHWSPWIECDAKGKVIRFRYTLSPIYDRDVAVTIEKIAKASSDSTIDSVKTERKHRPTPHALNTVELLRAASTGLGIGPSDTMTIAERLYTQGLISYPRTETTKYASNFNCRSVLSMFTNHSEFGQIANEIISGNKFQVPKKGKDCGDHPPITPVGVPSSPLSGDHRKIYDYVVRHFLATMSKESIYDETHVITKVAYCEFEAHCKTEIDPGWTAIMPWKRMDNQNESQILFESIKSGDVLPIVNTGVQQGKTSPPGYLTESELISLMEKNGIGTDASIPVHIKNICDRRYVNVEGKRRQLVPTTLGITLVHGYQKIDPELCQSHMRSAIEKELRLIAKGEALFDDVLNHVLKIYEEKFKYFTGNIDIMDRLFEDSFTLLTEAGKAISRCGMCRRFMRLTGSTEQCGSSLRLHCSNCKQTYLMPVYPGKTSSIRPYGEQRCPLDDFELVVSACDDGKCQVLCPLCFNDPPFPSMVSRSLSTCLHCPHISCPHSFNAQGLSACFNCDTGILVLDSTSKPRYRITCSDCNTSMNLPKHSSSVRVLNEQCKRCGCYLMNVPTTSNDVATSNTNETCCFMCDPMFYNTIRNSRVGYGRSSVNQRFNSRRRSTRSRSLRSRGFTSMRQPLRKTTRFRR
ncbi:hypothetical protein GJ496_001660 [Pomphorhynchus laevis]|nr:hypothetical protein GJ496_001660 [Pomphorhynchus laevis]